MAPPGLGHRDRPGAVRAEASGAAGRVRQPVSQRWVMHAMGARAAGDQQQVDIGGVLLQTQVSLHLQARRAAHQPFGFRDGEQLVVFFPGQQTIVDLEDVHGACHVVHQHVFEQNHHHCVMSLGVLHTSTPLLCSRAA